MFTAWCLAVVAGSVGGMGLPLCWLLNGRRPLSDIDYVKAPFLGTAAIILIVQNLFYHDVTVARSAPVVWGVIALLWLAAWRAGQPGAWWRGRPRGLAAAAVLAFMVQGLGLLRLGADEYVGRLWSDQFNYTATAQYALEQPFSFPLSAVGNRPYLIQGVRLKFTRIGAPMMQAFFAASCYSDARPLFEPAILLLPPLTVFAAFGVGRRLGLERPHALLAAVTAGLLPAVAAVHLEGFLSQALCLPFLLAWPVFLGDLSEHPSFGRLAAAALCAAAGFSIYVELYPLFLGASAVLLGVAAVGDRRRWRLPACAVTLAVAPVLLNPSFAVSGWRWLRILDLLVLQHIYPWAYRPEGLARLWAGDFAALPSSRGALAVAGAALTALAFAGLLLPCVAVPRDAEDRAARWRGLGESLAVLALALVPVAVVLKDRDHPYQFYKLACTVSPLLAVGLLLAVRRRPAIAVPVLLLAAVATGGMALATTRPVFGPRSATPLVRGPGLRELARRLEEGPAGPLLIASADARHNPWLTYFARHHRVWLHAPRINDSDPFESMLEARCVTDLTALPDDCLLLGSSLPWLTVHPGPTARVEFAAGLHRLWRTTARAWALPTDFAFPAGFGADGLGPFFRVGPELTRVELLAICAGELTISGRFAPVPGGRLLLRARGPNGDWEQETAVEGEGAWRVPLAAGTTELTLRTVEGPPLVVHGLRLEFATPVPPGSFGETE